MTTLHIMLASGENLPNLIPAIASLEGDPDFRADIALILGSMEMRKRGNVETLKAALEASGIKKVNIHQADCPDHDLAEMRQWAKMKAVEITENYYDNRRILNLTGGNKLMTIAFWEAFQEGRAEIIYCDTEHNRIEYISSSKNALHLPVNILKLDACLAAQGYALHQDKTDEKGIQARKELTRKLVEIAPRGNGLIHALNAAFFDFDKDASGMVLTNELKPEEKNLLAEIQQFHLLEGNRLKEENAARYLGGGWMEEWCWLVGKKLEQGEPGKRLHRNRWGINQKIKAISNSPYPLNELDAVFIHRNRMLLIECKTGLQLSGRDESQDILNKLEALGSQFGGRLNTKWLLTARPIQKNTQASERARRYGIHIIGPGELIHLKDRIQQWMTA